MQLKYINLNLWDRGTLVEQAVAFLKQEHPDIIALQEVCSGKNRNLTSGWRSLSFLHKHLDFPYCFYAPAFFEMREEKVESGNAIFSRFPIVKEQTLFFDIPYQERRIDETDFSTTPRNLQHASIAIGNRILHVFNTQGIWGTHGGDTQRRLAMCQLIADAVRTKSPTILSGDFNVHVATRSIALIEEVLDNVFKGRLTTTFNMLQKKDPNFARAVVDFVFASRDINIISRSCPNVNVSDHLPLVVVFEI